MTDGGDAGKDDVNALPLLSMIEIANRTKADLLAVDEGPVTDIF